MGLLVGTGKAKMSNDLLVALARGRRDRQYFSRTWLGRTLHDAQLEYVENADATVNALATANRFGKTTILSDVHFHGCIYKTGGEPKYLDPVTAEVDFDRWFKLRYNTIHTADLWETAALVWDDAHKLINEQPYLQAFVKARPRTLPPHIDFIHDARWKFRTLGDDASGIDGNSFYVITVDEAGWITDLQEKMDNVIRVRVADVRGVIHIVGTFKPGISKDFYVICVRAAAYTGTNISLDHRADEDVDLTAASDLDASIRGYLRTWVRGELAKERELSDDLWPELAKLGINRDEFADAIAGKGV